MSDKKPNVFPTNGQTDSSNEEPKSEEVRSIDFETEKSNATQEIYINAINHKDIPSKGEANAVEAMRLRTEEQLREHNEKGVVKEPELAETTRQPMTRYDFEMAEIYKKTQEQIKLRDELLNRNSLQTENYQKQTVESPKIKEPQIISKPMSQNTSAQLPRTPEIIGQAPINPYIIQLSQPDYNSPFDVIPLPSQGKLYPSKKPNIKVSFITTADESILSSPNLLQSGEFLEILMNRKILDQEIRYKDLHVGDRNAIMIWLRATAYGEIYPVTLLDENNEVFETELNLNDLVIKNLGAEPDQEGLFDFTFKLCKSNIKFKLLTCGDVDDIETIVSKEKIDGCPIDNTIKYHLERMIIEVDGSRDATKVKEFANNLRPMDNESFGDYIQSIASGVDLNITVGTPGGGSVTTFLPLNVNFFWPKLRL